MREFYKLKAHQKQPPLNGALAAGDCTRAAAEINERMLKAVLDGIKNPDQHRAVREKLAALLGAPEGA